MPLKIGSTLDGRFTIIDKLGEGGMSVVWLARQSSLNMLRAVKEIKRDASTATHRIDFERAKNEANIMKELDHPAFPHITDIIDDGTALYVVMDFISGKDLEETLLDRGAAFPEADVVRWGIQLCDALGYLHAQNPPVIYRDMKPKNVMLQEDGNVKVIDFGIARTFKPGQGRDTTALGTRGYAPPEAYVEGTRAQTDARSDVYTLGVTLFHLVTGHGPMEYFNRPSLPPIREIDPSLSPALEATIIKATQWDPGQRQQSMVELRVDLEDPKTPGYWLALRRRRRVFVGLAVAGVTTLALGGASVFASNLVRGSSFDGLLDRAATASVEEVDGRASQAEELYVQAVSVMSGDLRPYDALVNDVYKADSRFTTSEAGRWNSLFEENRASIEQADGYAKLCYDAGIDYFIYYDYGDELTRGSQAVNWFRRALDADEARPGALTAQQRNTVEAYVSIGEFSQLLTRAVQEGTESEAYADYWESLESAVESAGTSETIVQLRLYDVVYEAINSPVYLSGFLRAGVGRSRVESLLGAVLDQTRALGGAADASEVTQELYEHVTSGIEDGPGGLDTAAGTIEATYDSVGARTTDSLSGSSATADAEVST